MMQTNLENLISIAKRVYEKELSTLNKRFDGGYATCTYASYMVGKALDAEQIDFTVVSGDFEDSGHWWIITTVNDVGKQTKVIVDLGDNYSDSSIRSGKVPFKIVKESDPNFKSYKPEDKLSWRQYKSTYNQIKDF